MILILQNPGIKVGKKSELITIKQAAKQREISVRLIESVLVMARVHISHDALNLLAQHCIPVFYLSNHKPLGVFMPFAHHGFVMTRRAQFASYQNEKGLDLIKQIVNAALINKSRMLRYYAKNRRKNNPDLSEQLIILAQNIEKLSNRIDTEIPTANLTSFSDQICSFSYPILEYREKLMGLEGMGANIYFHGIRLILPQRLNFTERNRRPPRDPINSALSFGYHLLANEVLTAIAAAGLEPYAGFLHSDRSGRPSLVFDLIEEFRQPLVDRLVFRLFQKKILQPKDFDMDSAHAGVKFKKDALERFLGEFYYMIRKDGLKISKFFTTYQQIILKQARKMVRYFLEKDEFYKPFLFQY